jgi:hypothetical protein
VAIDEGVALSLAKGQAGVTTKSANHRPPLPLTGDIDADRVLAEVDAVELGLNTERMHSALRVA